MSCQMLFVPFSQCLPNNCLCISLFDVLLPFALLNVIDSQEKKGKNKKYTTIDIIEKPENLYILLMVYGYNVISKRNNIFHKKLLQREAKKYTLSWNKRQSNLLLFKCYCLKYQHNKQTQSAGTSKTCCLLA